MRCFGCREIKTKQEICTIYPNNVVICKSCSFTACRDRNDVVIRVGSPVIIDHTSIPTYVDDEYYVWHITNINKDVQKFTSSTKGYGVGFPITAKLVQHPITVTASSKDVIVLTDDNPETAAAAIFLLKLGNHQPTS